MQTGGTEFGATKTKSSFFSSAISNALVFDFPDAPKNKILSYKKDSIDMDIDVKELTEILKKRDLQTSLDIEDEEKNKITNIPRLPDFLSDGLREYQEKAIAAWKDNNYIGIFPF